MRTILTISTVTACVLATATMSTADTGNHVDEKCNLKISLDEMTNEDAHDVYTCLANDMAVNYIKGPKRWIPREFVEDYRSWTAASTLPTAPGMHSGLFLFTYVNAAGEEEYLKFADGDVAMPEGSVLAKESFSIDEDGTAKPGPLFFMQKAEKDASPRTNDWYYMAVSPKGVPMGVNVYTACNECHEAYKDSDYMAYPVEEVRVSGD